MQRGTPALMLNRCPVKQRVAALQIGKTQRLALAVDHTHAINHCLLQLPRISWPVVALQFRNQLSGDITYLFPEHCIVFLYIRL